MRSLSRVRESKKNSPQISFEMLGSANPLSQCHIPNGLNPTGREYLCFIKNEELLDSMQ